jgi:predicted nucleic acid-binding protein
VAEFDIGAALKWARFDPCRTLARRPDADLPFITAAMLAGQPLLLDTCVYIDQAQGRAPPLVEQLIEHRQTNHSAVAMQELTYAIGALDPGDGRTKGAIAAIRRLIEAMPPHRVFTPDADILGRAALMSGILSRTQGYARDARLRALADCTLFLQAHKLGLSVLTANVAEFDPMLQLIPSGRVLFYRRG